VFEKKGECSPNADWSDILWDKGWILGRKISLTIAGVKTNDIITKHVHVR